MEKLEYLVRTLSRTKRKDYENYVVNAIWNRLADNDIQPVTQKLVAKSSTERYFIDLYFPQLNIGIECNEPSHLGQQSQDEIRQWTIFDVLHQVQPTSGYQQIDIDIADPQGRWLSLADVSGSIDRAVERLRSAVQTQKRSGAFDPWTGVPEDPITYVQSLKELSVADDVRFRTMAEACNALFSDDYRSLQKSYFIPRRLKPVYGDEYHVWFPKAELQGNAVSRGWHNILSADGMTLEEYNDGWDAVDSGDYRDNRIVFIQNIDPILRTRAYQFAGVFKRNGTGNINGLPTKHYERVSTTFPVLPGEAEKK
ncbi:AbaSI family restriction endonuclease [Changpingibacter yushuensis]|uniref:AbaSI family restriction endonuclease n=1 Tax=Changpingibacter yushuensis TaxID=2758440 RepID=UPI0015F756F6|nr:restriction endonuclease [Changpingibacter yushuensis]